INSQQHLPPIGQRLSLFFYGIASTCYRVFVGIMIILLVAWQVPVLGVLMAFGGVATWILVPVFKTFKYLALDPELHRKRVGATAFVLGVVVAVIATIGLLRFPVNVDATGVLEPEHKEVVNARQGGFVTDLRGRDA